MFKLKLIFGIFFVAVLGPLRFLEASELPSPKTQLVNQLKLEDDQRLKSKRVARSADIDTFTLQSAIDDLRNQVNLNFQSVDKKLDSLLVSLGLTLGCKGIFASGKRRSGVYSINTNSAGSNYVKAYCDMEEDGLLGWTVIQRRGVRDIPKSQRESFYRNWTEYENGFGSADDDHWIGLQNMHSLTRDCENELKITLTKWDGTKLYARYSNFKISGKEDDYRLTIGTFIEGTLSNSESELSYNNNMNFSTYDKDNDRNNGLNCAEARKGAWWHDSCSWVSLNGEYADDGAVNGTMKQNNGIFWNPDFSYSYKKSEMKIRSKC